MSILNGTIMAPTRFHVPFSKRVKIVLDIQHASPICNKYALHFQQTNLISLRHVVFFKTFDMLH